MTERNPLFARKVFFASNMRNHIARRTHNARGKSRYKRTQPIDNGNIHALDNRRENTLVTASFLPFSRK